MKKDKTKKKTKNNKFDLLLKKRNVILVNENEYSNYEEHKIIQPTIAKKVKETRNNNIPWIEKYRPRILDDIVINKPVYNKIKKIIDDRDMPNIIITGVPGIGKTTTIFCIARAILGKYYNQAVLELNASDDRGIKAVQDLIIYFCKKMIHIDDRPDRKYAKHKIVMLDEADNMTVKAQQLINNLMEKYNKTTRFAFTCNNSSGIIEAIQSRCLIFRYKRLSNSQVIHRLKIICSKENVEYDDQGIDALVVTAEGDMRKAINNLQLTFNGYKKITEEYVYKLCDKPHPLMIKNIFISCLNKDLKNALKLLKILKESGYSSADISLEMVNILKSNIMTELDEETKIKYLTQVAYTALNISRGINSFLQLSGCVSKLCYQ